MPRRWPGPTTRWPSGPPSPKALRERGETGLLEERQIDRFSHRLVAGILRVQVIPGVVQRVETLRVHRVARDLVEIDHRVVFAARPNPFIERLSLGFPFGRVVGRALEWRQRGA